MALNAANLRRLAQSAPTAARLYQAWQRAQRGDRQAIDYLRSEGWAEAVDLLVAPGAGAVAKEALGHATDAYRVLRGIRPTSGGDVVDAEYRVLEETEAEAGPRPPWSPFLARMFRQPYGGHVILGGVGSGKTSLAVKLAHRYQQEHGFAVECCQMYGEDLPPFAVSIGKDTLVKRMDRLSRFLDSQNENDEDAPDAEWEQPRLVNGPAAMPPRGRVIIIDEASLSLSNNPHDPTRRAAIQALTQCRHVSYVVLYIAQWAGQLPLSLLGQTTAWIKSPDGREAFTDRDNFAVKDLWRRAGDAFHGLKDSAWYVDPHRDRRSWAFVDAPPINGIRGYSGLIPFTPYKAGD